MKLNLGHWLQAQACVFRIGSLGFSCALSSLSVWTNRLHSSDPLYYDERNTHNHEDETQCHKHHCLENINGSEKKKKP